eukprot:3276402-Amphidinium_carterae.1
MSHDFAKSAAPRVKIQTPSVQARASEEGLSRPTISFYFIVTFVKKGKTPESPKIHPKTLRNKSLTRCLHVAPPQQWAQPIKPPCVQERPQGSDVSLPASCSCSLKRQQHLRRAHPLEKLRKSSTEEEPLTAACQRCGRNIGFCSCASHDGNEAPHEYLFDGVAA